MVTPVCKSTISNHKPRLNKDTDEAEKVEFEEADHDLIVLVHDCISAELAAVGRSAQAGTPFILGSAPGIQQCSDK